MEGYVGQLEEMFGRMMEVENVGEMEAHCLKVTGRLVAKARNLYANLVLRRDQQKGKAKAAGVK
jgi:hypothetical protein